MSTEAINEQEESTQQIACDERYKSGSVGKFLQSRVDRSEFIKIQDCSHSSRGIKQAWQCV